MTSRNGNTSDDFKPAPDHAAKEDAANETNPRHFRRVMMAGLALGTTAFTFQQISDFTSISLNAESLSLTFCLALFLGIPGYLVVKCLVPTDTKDYSAFDVVVAEVAKNLEPIQNEQSSKTPLLHRKQPPNNVVIPVEDTQASISSTKSGEPFRLGRTTSATLRLNFHIPDTNEGGLSISGSTSAKSCNFTIERGVLCAVSGKAWWEETSNGMDLRRVVSGEFRDEFTSFSGEWYASDGSRGSLRKVINNAASTSIDYALPL